MDSQKLLNPNNKYSTRLLSRGGLMFLFLAICGSAFYPVKASDPPSPKDSSEINAAIAEFEPALAVRASSCVTCHAKIKSRFVTDLGYGDSYFFGDPLGKGKLGPFSGHAYGDFYGGDADRNKTAWLTAEIEEEIIVPQASLDFDLSSFANEKHASQSNYAAALQAKSLAGYLQAVENQKENPSKVIEKGKVFIGSPDAATLEARFKIASGLDTQFQFLKNDAETSPDISGIALNSDNSYFTNTGDVVCDGDLFVRGMLFLDNTTIVTQSGCRIYATGPIFLQNAVTFKSLSDDTGKTNLQMVSSEAILMGIGEKNCTGTTYPDPLSTRFQSAYALTSFITRATDARSIPAETAAQKIYDQAKQIPSLDDASCHDESLEFSRILLNAPQVHSRYTGRFKGVVVAEFALFRLANQSFEFDPVFKKVPVLPLLKDSDYLLIE